jgi:hypothetical protein
MKKSKYTPKPATTEQIEAIKKVSKLMGRNPEDFAFNVSYGRTTSVERITYKEAAILIEWLNNQTKK